MSQTWQEIWNRKLANGPLDLASLVKLDGFDTGAGRIAVEDWQAYCTIIGRKLGLHDGASVFEVGCGAGAFLYGLRQTGALEVGGIDYAGNLIGASREAMPDGKFQVGDARDVSIEPQYDYVLSNSLFQYLAGDSGSVVMNRMIDKARIAVAILEVPDASHKIAAETLRRRALSPGEYELKYKGLEHSYYAREWFVERAHARGLAVELFDGCVPHYAQNEFRFGAIIRKAAA